MAWLGACNRSISASVLIPLWSDPLPDGTQGVAYSYTLTASGGVPPYSYSIINGVLPAGITLNGSTGVLSGTPTGTASFVGIDFGVKDSQA